MANGQEPRPLFDGLNPQGPQGPQEPRSRLDEFNPQGLPPPVLEDSEELHPPLEECEFGDNDIAFFIVRCLTLFFCLIGMILVLVNIIRGNRLKSWRLYFTTALSVFAWVALTLYQDKVDEFCVQELIRSPGTGAIYACFRNFVHGFSLYLILLLLAHLSDMQHRCQWFGFIAISIFIPLLYSVGLLIFDLRVRNQHDWISSSQNPNYSGTWTKDVKMQIHIAIDAVRTFLYNIVTTILLFVMSKSFCTTRLYGTYSEKRSKVVVMVARWTYSFLLLHNLISLTSFALNTAIRIDVETYLSKFTLAHTILSELELITVVLSVPMSYLIGMMCCGGWRHARDLEMDKVDKIYTDVWTTPSARNPSSLVNSRPTSATSGSRPTSAASGTRPASATPNTNPSGSMTGNNLGLQNGVVARRNHGSNSTLSSMDSIGELPPSRITTNPGGGSDRKRRVRESYMEAVSTGSLNDDRSSMTSEPIDL